jgi:hypothetical protein
MHGGAQHGLRISAFWLLASGSCSPFASSFVLYSIQDLFSVCVFYIPASGVGMNNGVFASLYSYNILRNFFSILVDQNGMNKKLFSVKDLN